MEKTNAQIPAIFLAGCPSAEPASAFFRSFKGTAISSIKQMKHINY